MAQPIVWIKELSRQPQHGPEDRLAFTTGVNVVVGPPNTGKTKWLQILDYLMGNDGRPEEVLGDEVFAKYDSAEAVLVAAGQEIRVQRRWKQAGARTKVFLDDGKGKGGASKEKGLAEHQRELARVERIVLDEIVRTVNPAALRDGTLPTDWEGAP